MYVRWQGKCDACGEWNTMVEEAAKDDGFSKLGRKREGRQIDFVPLKGSMQTYSRLKTGIAEIDRVTGGGLVPGSVILVAGDPGIGKSTLLLQICAGLAGSEENYPCYYISGEEAIDQVRIRAGRLGLSESPVSLASATDVRNIVATIEPPTPPATASVENAILNIDAQPAGTFSKFTIITINVTTM